ncbi:MAG: low-complexity protein, partial [Mastigocladus sp. ERB_26_1]
MSIDSNSSQTPNPESITEQNLQPDDFENSSNGDLTSDELTRQQALAAIVSLQSPQNTAALLQARSTAKPVSSKAVVVKPRALLLIVVAIATTIIGLAINNWIVGILGTVVTLLLSLAVIWPWLEEFQKEWFSAQEQALVVGLLGIIVAIAGLVKYSGLTNFLVSVGRKINWEASGTLAEWFGALGQILIAIIAVYIAWRQYIISKDLTIQQNLLTVQQNLITQQQTIDSYFQGISDLVLDEEGLLEDWPQERLLAEGRTAAILSSVDGSGKAKILRFLSRSKLLSP